MMLIGPRNPISQQLHASKYRQRGESFDDYCVRYARTTADDEKHFRRLLERLRDQAILPAGRQQRAVGWPFQTTAFNCFVGGTIADDTRAIGESLTDAMMTLRSGGGCGWDFSTLRGEGEPIRRLGDDAYSSGPVSFMGIWNAMCNTIRSAGERRGAMMAVLRVDHPDILTFVRAKQDQKSLTNFNISVGITSEFMEAVETDSLFWLRFPAITPLSPPGTESRKIRQVRALDLWSIIMENNWDWAEPGVLFLDTINRMNPLGYCEWIAATNPCSEQPLPPDGACLLLSHNIPKYLVPSYSRLQRDHQLGNGLEKYYVYDHRTTSVPPCPSPARYGYEIDYSRLRHDVNLSVRACDNVFERTIYPLPVQEREAFAKRRMGVGVTGVANALEICGYRYGTPEYIAEQSKILEMLRDTAYRTSIDMAKTKGSFPLFDAPKWLASGFAETLPDDIRDGILRYGLRNGLLLSIAPTGTISITADNVSSGIEPPPVIESTRTVNFSEGPRNVELNDWAYEEFGVRGRTAMETSPAEHVDVLCAAQRYVDSAISKTINLRGVRPGADPTGDEISFAQFRDVYRQAYRGGAKGCAAYNANGKRAGIIVDRKPAGSQVPGNGTATGGGSQVTNGELAGGGDTAMGETLCEIDPTTGARNCG